MKTDNFELRVDLEEKVETQLINKVSEFLQLSDDECTTIYKRLKNCHFLQITPPQDPPATMSLIILDHLQNYNEGCSIKPGNIVLNIYKLIQSIPSILSDIIEMSIEMPNKMSKVILCVHAALDIWKEINDRKMLNPSSMFSS